MSALSALALTLAALQSRPQIIDGFEIPVEIKFGEPKAVGAETTLYEAQKSMTAGQAKGVVGLYSVRIADLSKITPKPAAAQVFMSSERTVRTLQGISGINLRRSSAKMGSHPAQILNGAGMVRDVNGRATSIYLLSVSVVTDNKFYEFNSLSYFAGDHSGLMRTFNRFGLTEPGKDKVMLSGYPADEKGQYILGGIPFALECGNEPYPLTLGPKPGFKAHYTGTTGQSLAILDKGGHYTYTVCQLNPDDKRTDAEIFQALAQETKFAPLQPEQFKVTDGSGKLSFDWEQELEGTRKMPWSTYFQFERKGEWVALLAGKAKKAFGFKLAEGAKIMRLQ
jgi:hypothetical protein